MAKETDELKEKQLSNVSGGFDFRKNFGVEVGDFVIGAIIKDETIIGVIKKAYRIARIDGNKACLSQYNLYDDGSIVINDHPKAYDTVSLRKIEQPDWINE